MSVTYILRHAATACSAGHLVNGDPRVHVPLTIVGEEQCRQARVNMSGNNAPTWVTSAFARCQRTAQLIAPGPVEIAVDPRLNELDYGLFEAGNFLAYARWLAQHGPRQRPPGAAESQSEGVVRMLTGLMDVLARPAPRVVVAHGLLVSALTWAVTHPGQALRDVFLPAAPCVEPLTLSDADSRGVAGDLLAGLLARPLDSTGWHVDLAVFPQDVRAGLATVRPHHPGSHDQRQLTMHEARTLLELGDEAVRRLARRGYNLELKNIETLFTSRNSSIQRAGDLRAESKKVAAEVGRAAKSGGDTSELKERARSLKDEIRSAEVLQAQAEAELQGLMLSIPNFPADDVPDGDSEEFNVEIRRHGEPPSFSFEPKDHVDLGEGMGILDLTRATKLSGSRFAVATGAGAALERALANFFLSLHTSKHGYTEVSVPTLVSRRTMTGTGQLPKFEEDLFKTGVADRELFLIPTAEVPLTNLHADEILALDELPMAYTAWTPCFRSEAGSYGRDTRGILRLHQFSKVELVRICAAEDSRQELETMLSHAEACLKELGMAYRVVALAAGDLGFSATFTYDIEVWLPSQGTYREISSCSDCGTFQATRAAIRAKSRDGKRGPVATLNGSGLPIGRTLAALLEQNQQSDGSVVIPDALVPFTGFSRIRADGTPEQT
jgi:seryl-tRNA synthetase